MDHLKEDKLKLFLLDDDVNICKLIINLINWNAFNLVLVGESYNSIDALKKIKYLKPDIIILDIQIPDMNGLDLIERIKSSNNDVIFIVISGYEYFQYAKKAIELGVQSFLVKPIGSSELNNALKKAIEILKINLQLKKQAYILRNIQHKSITSRRNKLISDIIEARINLAMITLDEINDKYSFKLRNENFKFVLLRQDGALKQLGSNIYNSLLEKNIKILFNSLSTFCFDLHFIIDKNYTVYLLLNYSKLKSNVINLTIEKSLSQILEDSKGRYKNTLALGKEVLYDDLILSLKTATKALNSRIIVGTDKTIEYHKLVLTPKYIEEQYKSYISCHFGKALVTLDASALKDLVSTALINYDKEFQKYSDSIYIFAECILGFTINYLKELIDNTNELKCLTQYNITNYYTTKDIILYTTEYILELIKTLRKNIQLSETNIILLVKKHINNYYNKKIKLDELADIANLSKQYLCSFFKKQAGLNISEYITQIRMENAKKLLVNSSKSISNIANSIGYYDSKYFSKLFLKAYGLRPKDYRKLYK